MSYTKQGRLYRVLERLGISTPLLQITGDTFSVTDNQITSVSISHGGTDPSPGIQPSTCETVLQRPSWIKTGEGLAVKLTDAAATGIAARTGIPALRFTERFTGRVGRQTNTDTPRGLSARLTAASWSAQLSRTNVEFWISAQVRVHDAIRYLSTPAAVPQINFIRYGTFDTIAADIPDASYRNTIASLTSEIGVLVRDTRAGALEAWALPYRKTWAEQQLANSYPLTRSQAISPATWEQPNEDLPAKVRADWIAPDATVKSRSAGGTDTSIVDRHDWTHIREQTDALNMRFDSLVYQEWNRVFRIPSITVDLLYLLSSDKAYHRGQAGMILSLNAGDTIGLSGDWYKDLQGIHVVSGIDEKISQNEWTITLSLIPHLLVFGGASPAVPALIWESATYPWDEDSRSWDNV